MPTLMKDSPQRPMGWLVITECRVCNYRTGWHSGRILGASGVVATQRMCVQCQGVTEHEVKAVGSERPGEKED